MQLTPEQKSRYRELKKFITAQDETVGQWREGLIEIRQQQLYLVEYRTFEDFCKAELPVCYRTVARWLAAERAAKALPEKSECQTDLPDKCQVDFQKTDDSVKKPLPTAAQARRDPSPPVYIPPEPKPASGISCYDRVNIIKTLDAACRDLDFLLHETGFSVNQRFRHAVGLIHQTLTVLQPEQAPLGTEFEEKKKRFRPPTATEYQAYAIGIGLPGPEAEKWFNYREAGGWMQSGQPIKNWQASMRFWKSNWVDRGAPVNGKKQPETSPTIRRLERIVV
jgi:hypothetical protein